jgi:integrase
MRRKVKLLDGYSGGSRSSVEAAYDHFRLDRQGNLVAASTLERYDWMAEHFFGWLRAERPDLADFRELDLTVIRQFRVAVADRKTPQGKPWQPATLQDIHRMLKTFLNWATDEGYPVDPRILRLKAIRVPVKEATVFHIAQLHKIFAACRSPREELAVRILVGSGVRCAELIGLCVVGPDGLPDLMLDSVDRGRVELRVRWDAGAKGRKSRRVPVTPKLASAMKRYEARDRGRPKSDVLLVNEHGRPYTTWGIDQLMDRLEARVGFHVHAHAFRHTFATVACQLGWNLERLRAAMGHADYTVLHRYVRLATERDLGRERDWEDFIVTPTAMGSGVGRQR